MTKSGIYIIRNIINNKGLVGYSKNLRRRKNWHFCLLRNNKHSNERIQNSWNKYKEENFRFEILEECHIENLPKQEHYWTMLLKTHDRRCGFNILPTDPDNMRIVAPETGRKISKALTGIKRSEKTKLLQKLTHSKINYIAVLQYDLEGKLIEEYENMTIASRMTGSSRNSIKYHCEANLIGSTKKIYNCKYLWRYKCPDKIGKRVLHKYKLY